MTENTVHPDPSAAPPPPPPPGPSPVFDRPPLRRPFDDRVVVGVASGVARYLRIDPVIVRVLFVVLALFGGIGVVLYAIGWLLIPDDGDGATSRGKSLLDQAGPPGSPGRIAMTVVAVLLGVMIFVAYAEALPFGWMWGIWGFGGVPLLLLAVGGVAAYLILRDRPPAGTAPAQAAAAAQPEPFVQMQNPPAEPGTTEGTAAMTAPLAPPAVVDQTTPYAYGGSGDYPGYTPPTPTPPPAPRPPRPRSYLGLATLSLAALVVGALAAMNVSGVASIPAVVVLSIGLAILAGGLLVGAFVGRARWLIAVAAPLLLLIALIALIPAGLRLNGGVGDRTWVPLTTDAAAGPFNLGMGDATLDLTRVVFAPDSTEFYPVDVSVGVGELTVVVPDDVDVVVDARVGLGEIDVDGVTSGGSNRHVETTLTSTTHPAPTIVLDADINLGSLEVSRG